MECIRTYGHPRKGKSQAGIIIMLAQSAASLALTLKVQRVKHAINDNFRSYAVEIPLNCKIPKKGAIESSYFYFPA